MKLACGESGIKFGLRYYQYIKFLRQEPALYVPKFKSSNAVHIQMCKFDLNESLDCH